MLVRSGRGGLARARREGHPLTPLATGVGACVIEQFEQLSFQDFLVSIMQHAKDFKEFHRNNQVKQSKVKKAVLTYFANTEKERKKDEMRNERMRMQKLMQEDEEGYRQLLDEKKDKRLVFLLQQTDEYVESLTGLVKQHQSTEKRRKKAERRMQKAEDVSTALLLSFLNGVFYFPPRLRLTF